MEKFIIKTNSKTRDSQTIINNNVRVSVLTSKLIRVEKSDKKFNDLPTQKVWYRDFKEVSFKSEIVNEHIIIKTDDATFYVSVKSGLADKIIINKKEIIDFKKGNLKGTYRTLDGTGTGPIELDDGIMSKDGVSDLDDSDGLILDGDNILPAIDGSDHYYFAYGNNYQQCLCDFYNLTGSVPLVPRFCLGNWWSRYKAYTQDEYKALMEKFIEKKIPISVATIDMDWHWVDLKRFGKLANYDQDTPSPIDGDGWTGYSFNTDLFPNYHELFDYLHENNFKITLNIHPAHGVRSFENMYEQMCKAVGQDASKLNAVRFSLADHKFIDAYFNVLHHPYEKDGVDFWWIDWQQGTKSDVEGLDPLWGLNHYHYLDSVNKNKRGLILSRYCGLGSHRYPLGFSGDTFIRFEALDFQPYFTLTASNAGYTWWSHDIGGHFWGIKDNDLYLRWIQLGVFSPINRLHSTSNEYLGKEPWKFNYPTEIIATDYLRLRHKLIPYIYSMNYQTHFNGIPLCIPMYYKHKQNNAYKIKNEYYFGSELLVSPITCKVNPQTNYAGAKTWLPKGRWTDIFTNQIYNGNEMFTAYREINNIPVFAKQGAIIPTFSKDEENDCSINQDLDILIYRGNNTFSMYEDDGETYEYENGKYALRNFKITEKDNSIKFIIEKLKGDSSIYNTTRTFTLCFKDVIKADIKVDGKLVLSSDKHFVKVFIVDDFKQHVIELENVEVLKNTPVQEALINAIAKFQTDNDFKNTFNPLVSDQTVKIKTKPCFDGVLKEIINLNYKK